MHRLSDIIDRKFIDSVSVDDWEVETENGFVPIASSNKTVDYALYRVSLENGMSLECADTHILIASSGDEVFAKDSLGASIKTREGNSRVVSVDSSEVMEPMYDLSIDSDDHVYYTDGILSHNTSSVAVFILWYTLFHPNMYVAITANKSKNARKVLSRYQNMYKQLPRWLQQGVTTWNKGDIALENGSTIITSATTIDGVRGESCVAGDTMVCVEEDGAIFYCTVDQARNHHKPAYVQSAHARMIYCVFSTSVANSKVAGVLGVYGTVEECVTTNINNAGSCFVDGYLGDGVRLLTLVERYKPHNMQQRILGVFDNPDAAVKFMNQCAKELNNAHPD